MEAASVGEWEDPSGNLSGIGAAHFAGLCGEGYLVQDGQRAVLGLDHVVGLPHREDNLVFAVPRRREQPVCRRLVLALRRAVALGLPQRNQLNHVNQSPDRPNPFIRQSTNQVCKDSQMKDNGLCVPPPLDQGRSGRSDSSVCIGGQAMAGIVSNSVFLFQAPAGGLAPAGRRIPVG